ncbi:MAG: hypothetical protein U5K33_06725 [Halofilum sp. (in: g-proteobacteria)]|nr:hypothetical protein [Halofilum sp. (in: g-proteobacteria)]
MLVICNGAIKSGSTWLYNILVHLVELRRPPERYLTANSRKRESNPCIRPDMLAEFLASEDIRCDGLHLQEPSGQGRAPRSPAGA